METTTANPLTNTPLENSPFQNKRMLFWKTGFFIELVVIIALILGISFLTPDNNARKVNLTKSSSDEITSLKKALKKTKEALQKTQAARLKSWPEIKVDTSNYKSSGLVFMFASIKVESSIDATYSYILVDVSLINNGDIPFPISTTDFVLTNKSGEIQELVSDSDAISNELLVSTSLYRFPLAFEKVYLQPKSKIDGVVFFKVKIGENNFNLKYTPNMGSTNPIDFPISVRLPPAG